MACSSLHISINCACLLHKSKTSLGCLIKSCLSTFGLYRISLPALLKTHACKTSQGVVESHPNTDNLFAVLATGLPRCRRKLRRTVRRWLALKAASLLKELDCHTKHEDYPIRVTAAQDRLFNQHNLSLSEFSKGINELDENALCLIGSPLIRLCHRSDSHAAQKSNGFAEDLSRGKVFLGRHTGNSLLLLWSLQQLALAAVMRHLLDVYAEDQTVHSYPRWQYSKRIGEGWFAEWPNGHRPMCTTWPWNIKPSLLVLWGVCWMFYGPSGNNGKEPTRNGRGAAPLSKDIRTGRLGSQSQPSEQQDLSQAWAGPASNTYSAYSWPHPTRPDIAQHDASNTTHGNTLPTSYATSVPSYSYISASSSSPSDLYPTSTVWPYSQGINPVASPAYASTLTPWQTQSPFDPTGSVATTSQHTDRSNIVHPYAQRNQTTNTRNLQEAAGSLGSLGFGLGLQIGDMQNYPSPGSSTSEQTSSSYAPVLPSNVVSPGISLMPSPSVAGDTGFRQSSRRSQEPPRNAEGLLYCNHAEHAQQQKPVFSRRCEWRKHMDKHERPYVCEEPECDNIRGFTYSGGLLRHQREVHRKHGGPKASCMCPYPDCKRHVGAGFSRRENLAEHLRRVHRDTGADPMQTEGSESAQNTSGTSGKRRKRRRAVPEDDSEDEDDLEEELKKLKKELREKDDRLEKLERQVQLLVSGPKQ